MRIHYSRPDAKYENLGIWFWEDTKQPSANWPDGATKPSGKDSFGIYFDVELSEKPSKVSFLILNIKEAKQIEANNTVYLGSNREVYIVAGDKNVYDTSDLKMKPQLRQAIVTDRNTIKTVFSALAGIDAQMLVKDISIVDCDDKALTIDAVTVLLNSDVQVTLKSDIMEKLPLAVKTAKIL